VSYKRVSIAATALPSNPVLCCFPRPVPPSADLENILCLVQPPCLNGHGNYELCDPSKGCRNAPEQCERHQREPQYAEVDDLHSALVAPLPARRHEEHEQHDPVDGPAGTVDRRAVPRPRGYQAQQPEDARHKDEDKDAGPDASHALRLQEVPPVAPSGVDVVLEELRECLHARRTMDWLDFKM